MQELPKTATPTERAYWALVDLVRHDGAIKGQLFALVWLAAARMVVTRMPNGADAVSELADPGTWREVVREGLPTQAVEIFEALGSESLKHGPDLRQRATIIVVDLARELGPACWDVLPCLVNPDTGRVEGEGTVIPELAALALDILAAPPGSEVWIPFDPKGQLSAEALRRDLNVLAASPLQSWPLIRQLVLTIETGSPNPASVQAALDDRDAGRRSDYSLVMPPFGLVMKAQRVAEWSKTSVHDTEVFPRSESWAIFEFARRTKKRAVFVTTQGILFAKGHEQRLRELLVHKPDARNQVEAVVALPPGVFGGTSIAGALLTLDFTSSPEGIRLVDLGSSRRSLLEAGQVVASGRDLVLGIASTERTGRVTPDEIAANEFSLAPSRYLRKVADLGEPMVTLDDICDVVRPPAVTKDPTPYEVVEVGLPSLQKWQPISGELDKTVFLKATAKAATLVQPGDIVLCIKGSVGRVGLVGDAANRQSAVVSQSCVALRVNPNLPTMSPEVLLMYLRSPHGQQQLLGLQVGTGIQHISPGTLMAAVSVPLPDFEQFVAIRQDFSDLCELEHRIFGLEHRMKEIAWNRWPVDSL